MNKEKAEFQIPPVSTLIGSTFPNFFRVLIMGRPGLRFIPKLLLTLLVIIVSSPFQIGEYLYFRSKVKNFRFKRPPVFIIGHWRSGTTHLHNLLCQDSNHGYLTTYQSVFPNNLLSKWIFKTFMRIKIPEKRPSDNVKLSPDYPQEDEFALANMTLTSFYHFFYFPRRSDELYQRYVRFIDVNDQSVNTFHRKYRELLSKAAFNSGKDRLVVKNPVNTGRVAQLVKMYPDAKFIFIYRNPVTTYLSTLRFYFTLFPSIALETYNMKLIKEKIIRNYKNLMQDYLNTRELIPSENLHEIRFEDFDDHNLRFLKDVYDKFGLGTWDEAEPHFRSYVSRMRHYRKNRYKIKKEDLDTIMHEWGFAMKEFGYEVPENVEVV